MSIKEFFLLTLLAVATTDLTAMEQSDALTTDAKVEVRVNSTVYAFEQLPTLAEVLEPVALKQQWYWPASKLFRLNTVSLEPQRQALLTKLQHIASTSTPEQQNVLLALQAEVSGWQLAERVPITVDYDLARIAPAKNPRFTPGTYQLLLNERPSYLSFVGAISSSVRLAYQPATSLNEYIKNIRLSSFVDTANLYVVKPNGEVVKAGVQLWQSSQLQPEPGAMVIIPFQVGWLSDEMAEINELLITLAVNRVY